MQSKPCSVAMALLKPRFFNWTKNVCYINKNITGKNPVHVKEVCCLSLVTCKVLDFFSQTRLGPASLRITSPS